MAFIQHTGDPRRRRRAVRIALLLFLSFVTGGIVLAEEPAARIGLYTETEDHAGFTRIQEMLANASITPSLVSFSDDWGPYALVIMVKPPVAQPVRGSRINFAQKLGTYYLRGGRFVLVDVPGAGKYPSSPDQEIWNNLTRYLWDIPLHDISGTLEDSDGRAVFFPDVANVGSADAFKKTITRVLTANDVLPDQVPAEDFGPAPKIELRDNSLFVGGTPLLLRGVCEYDLIPQVPMHEHEERLRAFRELGFNFLHATASSEISNDTIRRFLEIARQNGIYVQVLPSGPLDENEPLAKRALLQFLRFRNHPMFIGWDLSDDMLDAYLPFVQKAVEIVRRYDHRQILTGTFIDARRPNGVGDWQKWKTLMDIPFTYLYPLQKDPSTLGVKGDIAGGFKDIDLLTRNAHHLWGDVFQEQAVQAHMQGVLAQMVGLKPWAEHLVPTADQERLMTYRALLSGVKGITYFYTNSLDDEGMGRNRRNELGLIWHEVAPVEDILASGRFPVPLHTSDTAVDASQIRAGTESVILVAKDHPYYNRYVDQAKVENVSVDLASALPAGASVYQLNLPHLQKLAIKGEQGRRSVALEPFALTALLLVTNDSKRVEKIQRAMENELSMVTAYALDVLADEQVKTEVTAAHLPPELRGSGALLQAGKAKLEEARRASSANDLVSAYQSARDGLLPLEEYRSETIKAAMKDADARHVPASVRVYLDIYFSLPVYAYMTRGGPNVAPGQLRAEILEAEGQPVWNYIDRVAH